MHADLGNHLQAYGVPKEDDVNNEQDYFWAVASSKPHEETPEFRVFAPDVAEKQQPVRQHPTMPRMQPERQQSFNPAPPGIRPNDIPAWMQELLAFRKPQPPVQVPSLPPTLDLQAQRRMQDALAISLLRMINEIRAQGEIKAKILLSRQAPNNKIKSLSKSPTIRPSGEGREGGFGETRPNSADTRCHDFRVSAKCVLSCGRAERDTRPATSKCRTYTRTVGLSDTRGTPISSPLLLGSDAGKDRRPVVFVRRILPLPLSASVTLFPILLLQANKRTFRHWTCYKTYRRI